MSAVSRRICPLLCVALAACGATAAQVDEPQQPPLDVGLEEQIDVHLVLVDFIVLDRKARTVPDLTADDLTLVVSGRETEIHSLDVDCPIGAAEEPLRGGSSSPASRAPTARPRRIVIVFDYQHMGSGTGYQHMGYGGATFGPVHAMLDRWSGGDEEHMIVSLGGVLRVEQPFTSDVDELRRTLQRMENDPALWAGNHGSLTNRGFFDRMEMLFDLLEYWDGRKSVVLFSGPLLPDGFYRDPELKRLSALSTATRTAVYPVDTGGVRTLIDPLDTGVLGPPLLRRLANETGGRMTANTNDIGLAYAKARRDLGCTYTLGFYHPASRTDQKRRLTIRVNDRYDVRVVYPEFYTVRSPEEKRRSMFRTAAMAPQMFESDEIKTDLFLLAPHSASRWRSVLAIEVRLGADAFVDEGEEWELKGMLRKPNGTIVRSFKKTIPMPPTDPITGKTPVVTVFQPLRTRPGRYVVSAVLSDPEATRPIAATRPAVIAEIPRGEPFLVGPLLGHLATDVGETLPDESDFEPMLVPEARRGEPLESWTVVCSVGAKSPVSIREIGRVLTSWEGSGAQRFDPVSALLSDESKVSCHHLIDRVDTARLEPGRYELSAVAETTDHVTGRGTTELTVLPPATK
jgi:VWFA-related protein